MFIPRTEFIAEEVQVGQNVFTGIIRVRCQFHIIRVATKLWKSFDPIAGQILRGRGIFFVGVVLVHTKNFLFGSSVIRLMRYRVSGLDIPALFSRIGAVAE
jgi:hypothetical protein